MGLTREEAAVVAKARSTLEKLPGDDGVYAKRYLADVPELLRAIDRLLVVEESAYAGKEKG